MSWYTLILRWSAVHGNSLSHTAHFYNTTYFSGEIRLVKCCFCKVGSLQKVCSEWGVCRHHSLLSIHPHYNSWVAFEFLTAVRLVQPCPTQQCWPRCQLCFRAKMCFKCCCRMVMCCATCQPTSILRQMGEAVVKKQPFLLDLSQRVIYHMKAWHNQRLSYGIWFSKDTVSGGNPPLFDAREIWHWGLFFLN